MVQMPICYGPRVLGTGGLRGLFTISYADWPAALCASWWPSKCGTAAAKMRSPQTPRSRASSHFTRGRMRWNGSLDCWFRELLGPDKHA